MKNKLLIWGLIFSVAVNISLISTIIVYPRWKSHKENSEPFIVRELGLSNSQVKKINSFYKSYLNQVEKLRTDLQKERTELTQLLIDGKANPLIIDAKLRKISFLQMQIQKETIEHLSTIEKEVFTPEQRQKFYIIIRNQLSPKRRKIEYQGRIWIRENFLP